MNDEKNKGWGNFLGDYFGKHKRKREEAKTINTNFNRFEHSFFESATKPETPSHIEEDEKYEEFVNEHIIEDVPQEIKTEQDALEAAMVGNESFIDNLEHHLDDGPTPGPEDDGLIEEEIRAFAELNKLDLLHETNEPEDILAKTTVKSVKVKPAKEHKAPKASKEPKPKKEKPAKEPKAPKKPKAPKAKK